MPRLDRRLLQEVTDHIEELPLLPVVANRLLALDPEADDYFEQVLTLAEEDPTFAVRLIRTANSVAFMPAHPIVDLRSAVARIGTRHIAGMITSLSVVEIFVPTQEDVRNLWLHSVQTAVAAKLIAHHHPLLHLPAEEAYLCGLLHDIGRFVLFDTVTDEIRHINEEDWDAPDQLITLEHDLLGMDHAEIGWRLCHKWRMPDKVALVVREHHAKDPADLHARHPEVARLIQLIQIADNLSTLLLRGNADGDDPQRVERELEPVIRRLCAEHPLVTAAQVAPLAARIEAEATRMIAALGLQMNAGQKERARVAASP